jgi:hypothetical protein
MKVFGRALAIFWGVLIACVGLAFVVPKLASRLYGLHGIYFQLLFVGCLICQTLHALLRVYCKGINRP